MRHPSVRSLSPALGVGLLLTAGAVSTQGRVLPPAAAPSRVPLLAESTEVRLAREAVSDSISRNASVYVFQGGHFVRAVTGTNGFACMVARDTRPEGRFPMCFDPEGAKALLPREMRKVELLAAGTPPDSLAPIFAREERAGRLPHPNSPALLFMMSSHQVLFDGEKNVGAWHPHVMIYLPHTSPAQFPLLPSSMNTTAWAGDGAMVVAVLPEWGDAVASK